MEHLYPERVCFPAFNRIYFFGLQEYGLKIGGELTNRRCVGLIINGSYLRTHRPCWNWWTANRETEQWEIRCILTVCRCYREICPNILWHYYPDIGKKLQGTKKNVHVRSCTRTNVVSPHRKSYVNKNQLSCTSRGGGYSKKFYTGRLRPEVQSITLLYTIFLEKAPLLYNFYWKKAPLSYTFLRRLLNKSLKLEAFLSLFSRSA